ncbi:MAG: hypothetical protein N3F62_04270, partial [Bacteroidia bacterium]|nr:hypothetical protein [Bacteroidia bacterium]
YSNYIEKFKVFVNIVFDEMNDFLLNELNYSIKQIELEYNEEENDGEGVAYGWGSVLRYHSSSKKLVVNFYPRDYWYINHYKTVRISLENLEKENEKSCFCAFFLFDGYDSIEESKSHSPDFGDLNGYLMFITFLRYYCKMEDLSDLQFKNYVGKTDEEKIRLVLRAYKKYMRMEPVISILKEKFWPEI